MTTNLIDHLGVGAEILRLRLKGMAAAQIADYLDLKLPTVLEWIANHE